VPDHHPVVFIHGLWLHASSWDRWVRLFASCGYAAVAPGWPGESPTVQATRQGTGSHASTGSAELGEHYARVAEGLTAQPVLIGNGLGGLLALTLSAPTHAAAVIAIDATPTPDWQPATRIGPAVLTHEAFHVVYGSALSREESDQLCDRWAIPAPSWALSQRAENDPRPAPPGPHSANSSRGPVLLVASGKGRHRDAAATPRLPMSATDVVVFPDRGPSLVIDSGWRLVAQSCLSWMDAQEL
jgi:pimeloyl-ACP methyl ester carboxylesterase